MIDYDWANSNITEFRYRDEWKVVIKIEQGLEQRLIKMEKKDIRPKVISLNLYNNLNIYTYIIKTITYSNSQLH